MLLPLLLASNQAGTLISLLESDLNDRQTQLLANIMLLASQM